MNYFIIIIFAVLMYLVVKSILTKSNDSNNKKNIIDVDYEEVE